jgi:hypothetical protein
MGGVVPDFAMLHPGYVAANATLLAIMGWQALVGA